MEKGARGGGVERELTFEMKSEGVGRGGCWIV